MTFFLFGICQKKDSPCTSIFNTMSSTDPTDYATTCDAPGTRFGARQKLMSSLIMGVIAFIVFGIFSSPLLYFVTSFLGSSKLAKAHNGRDIRFPTVTGNLLHAMVAGLVTLLIGYLIMMPWENDKCCKPMQKPKPKAMDMIRGRT